MKWIEKVNFCKYSESASKLWGRKKLCCSFQISNNNGKPLSNKYEEITLQESTWSSNLSLMRQIFGFSTFESEQGAQQTTQQALF